MTKEQAIQKLKAEQANTDTEVAHANADQVLVDFLLSLGQTEIVEEYQKVSKWFA